MCSVPGFSVHVTWEQGCFGFLILVYLGFLQVFNLVCKLSCADLQPGSCHPDLSFHTLQVHYPLLLLSFLKTNSNFSPCFGTPVGLLPV